MTKKPIGKDKAATTRSRKPLKLTKKGWPARASLSSAAQVIDFSALRGAIKALQPQLAAARVRNPGVAKISQLQSVLQDTLDASGCQAQMTVML